MKKKWMITLLFSLFTVAVCGNLKAAYETLLKNIETELTAAQKKNGKNYKNNLDMCSKAVKELRQDLEKFKQEHEGLAKEYDALRVQLESDDKHPGVKQQLIKEQERARSLHTQLYGIGRQTEGWLDKASKFEWTAKVLQKRNKELDIKNNFLEIRNKFLDKRLDAKNRLMEKRLDAQSQLMKESLDAKNQLLEESLYVQNRLMEENDMLKKGK